MAYRPELGSAELGTLDIGIATRRRSECDADGVAENGHSEGGVEGRKVWQGRGQPRYQGAQQTA